MKSLFEELESRRLFSVGFGPPVTLPTDFAHYALRADGSAVALVDSQTVEVIANDGTAGDSADITDGFGEATDVQQVVVDNSGNTLVAGDDSTNIEFKILGGDLEPLSEVVTVPGLAQLDGSAQLYKFVPVSGGFALAYATDTGVQVQRYSLTGAAVGGPVVVGTYPAETQSEDGLTSEINDVSVSASSDAAGDVAVAWTFSRIRRVKLGVDEVDADINYDVLEAGSGLFIRVQSADGSLRGPAKQVVKFTNLNSYDPTIAMSDSGNIAVMLGGFDYKKAKPVTKKGVLTDTPIVKLKDGATLLRLRADGSALGKPATVFSAKKFTAADLQIGSGGFNDRLVLADNGLAYAAVRPFVHLDEQDDDKRSTFVSEFDPANKVIGSVTKVPEGTDLKSLDLLALGLLSSGDLSMVTGNFDYETVESGDTKYFLTTSKPDLSAGPAKGSFKLSSRKAGTVSFPVKNGGGLGFSGQVGYRVWLSTDNSLDDSDVMLTAGASSTTLNIAAGKSGAAKSLLTVPAETPKGSYFLIFTLDPSNLTVDGDLTNNTGVYPLNVT